MGATHAGWCGDCAACIALRGLRSSLSFQTSVTRDGLFATHSFYCQCASLTAGSLCVEVRRPMLADTERPPQDLPKSPQATQPETPPPYAYAPFPAGADHEGSSRRGTRSREGSGSGRFRWAGTSVVRVPHDSAHGGSARSGSTSPMSVVSEQVPPPAHELLS